MDNEVLQMYDPFYEQVKSDKWLSLFFCPNILRVLTYAPNLFPRHSDTRPPCAMPQDELATEAGEAEEAAEGQGFSQGRQHPPSPPARGGGGLRPVASREPARTPPKRRNIPSPYRSPQIYERMRGRSEGVCLPGAPPRPRDFRPLVSRGPSRTFSQCGTFPPPSYRSSPTSEVRARGEGLCPTDWVAQPVFFSSTRTPLSLPMDLHNLMTT